MDNTGIFENGIEPKEFWCRLGNYLCSNEDLSEVYFFHEDKNERILLLGKSSDAEILNLPEGIRKKLSNTDIIMRWSCSHKFSKTWFKRICVN